MKNLLFVCAAASALAAPAFAADDKQGQHLVSHEEIKGTVDKHIADVKSCLKSKGAVTGKLVVEFGIMPNGHVIDPKPKTPSSNKELDRCIVDAFRKWEFPKPNVVQGVDYPFIFTVPKEAPKVDNEAEMKAIDSVIQSHMNVEVKKCYDDALGIKNDIAGVVNVEITISPTGTVAAAKLLDSTTNWKDLDACVVQQVKAYQFAKPAGGVNVTFPYPFVLKSPKKK